MEADSDAILPVDLYTLNKVVNSIKHIFNFWIQNEINETIRKMLEGIIIFKYLETYY